MAKTLLLVDDSATHRSLIRVFLTGHDLRFLEADGGAEALRILDRKHVDLLIVDVKMPGMDGLELVRRIRKQPETRDIPIVLLTASVADEIEGEGKRAGANALLHKPISSAGILEIVQRLLSLAPSPEA
jgi:two-component system chemotaxis response regulator CheY